MEYDPWQSMPITQSIPQPTMPQPIPSPEPAWGAALQPTARVAVGEALPSAPTPGWGTAIPIGLQAAAMIPGNSGWGTNVSGWGGEKKRKRARDYSSSSSSSDSLSSSNSSSTSSSSSRPSRKKHKKQHSRSKPTPSTPSPAATKPANKVGKPWEQNKTSLTYKQRDLILTSGVGDAQDSILLALVTHLRRHAKVISLRLLGRLHTPGEHTVDIGLQQYPATLQTETPAVFLNRVTTGLPANLPDVQQPLQCMPYSEFSTAMLINVVRGFFTASQHVKQYLAQYFPEISMAGWIAEGKSESSSSTTPHWGLASFPYVDELMHVVEVTANSRETNGGVFVARLPNRQPDVLVESLHVVIPLATLTTKEALLAQFEHDLPDIQPPATIRLYRTPLHAIGWITCYSAIDSHQILQQARKSPHVEFFCPVAVPVNSCLVQVRNVSHGVEADDIEDLVTGYTLVGKLAKFEDNSGVYFQVRIHTTSTGLQPVDIIEDLNTRLVGGVQVHANQAPSVRAACVVVHNLSLDSTALDLVSWLGCGGVSDPSTCVFYPDELTSETKRCLIELDEDRFVPIALFKNGGCFKGNTLLVEALDCRPRVMWQEFQDVSTTPSLPLQRPIAPRVLGRHPALNSLFLWGLALPLQQWDSVVRQYVNVQRTASASRDCNRALAEEAILQGIQTLAEGQLRCAIVYFASTEKAEAAYDRLQTVSTELSALSSLRVRWTVLVDVLNEYEEYRSCVIGKSPTHVLHCGLPTINPPGPKMPDLTGEQKLDPYFASTAPQENDDKDTSEGNPGFGRSKLFIQGVWYKLVDVQPTKRSKAVPENGFLKGLHCWSWVFRGNCSTGEECQYMHVIKLLGMKHIPELPDTTVWGTSAGRITKKSKSKSKSKKSKKKKKKKKHRHSSTSSSSSLTS